MRWKRTIWFILISVLFFALMVLPTIQVYRDWAFVSETTGSRQGYRAWFGFIQTGHWYQESALESFIKKDYPSELKHRWTSYAGTGKNIFGRAVLFGHGRPGAILQLPPDMMQRKSDFTTIWSTVTKTPSAPE